MCHILILSAFGRRINTRMKRTEAGMRDSNSEPTARDSAIGLLHEGMRQSSIHLNVGQQWIIVTEDKMRLGLIDLISSAKSRQAWQTPAAMMLTEIAILPTANFHAAIGISGDQWQALFGVLLIVTLLWLLTAWVKGRPGPSANSFIDSLKTGQRDPCGN